MGWNDERIKCYSCGLEADKGFFVSTSWTHTPRPGRTFGFWCPQCTSGQPKLGPVNPWADEPSPWPDPKWEVVETSQGVCIRIHSPNGSYTSLMVKGHQLEDAPASILREGLEGTLRNHSKRLNTDGQARSVAFHAECKVWGAANPAPRHNTHEHIDWQDTRRTAVDKAREAHGVGPHYAEVVHDSATLMQRAGMGRKTIQRIYG